MKTLLERERRAYAAGQPELADVFHDLIQAHERAEGLADLLADLLLAMEWHAAPAADKWKAKHADALDRWLE